MTTWQRRARLIIAVSAVAFAIVVALAFKRRSPQTAAVPVQAANPGAVVEVTGGRVERFKLSHEDVRVDYERQLMYANGSMKLVGVTIATEERGGARSFTVKGKDADVGQNESTIHLNGDVRLAASDGLAVRTEHASYTDKESMVRAAGPVAFSRGRMTGSGIGMTYDTANDVLVILDRAVVHVAADESGAGVAEIASGTATFARREKTIHFERDVKLRRDRQALEADAAVAHLTADETQIQTMELRGHSRVSMDEPAVGGLQALTGRDMDLKYDADGRALEHAVLMGDGAISFAGNAGVAGRQIAASVIEVTLAPDGATPVGLTGREAVTLTLPADGAVPARTIKAASMDAVGEPAKGLTRAQFAGNVQYRERGTDVDRTVTAGTLDVALKPAIAGIQEAKFARAVRFIDGGMTSVAAAARYDLDKGILELTGSEPGAVRPRVVNDQIAVDATRIDVTLAGPLMKATDAVKSVVQPAKNGRGGGASPGARLPSMFKPDAPVNVTADALEYNGAASKATYTGNAQLWQEEISVKGKSIVLDEKTGDLTASGGVATLTVRDRTNKDKKVERVRSIATAADFLYEDAAGRAIYTGDAHLNSPDGDMTAKKIELYLKPSGDELERVEGYESVTLHDRNRTTTGARLTYTTADERYVVSGTPVKVLDECRRETTGKSLTYLKSSDTITIDGNEQTRTQTKGSGAQCP